MAPTGKGRDEPVANPKVTAETRSIFIALVQSAGPAFARCEGIKEVNAVVKVLSTAAAKASLALEPGGQLERDVKFCADGEAKYKASLAERDPFEG